MPLADRSSTHERDHTVATIITKNGGFLARVRIKGFKPVSRAFDKRADALHWAHSVELAMRSGRYSHGADKGEVAGAVVTFAEALRAYRTAVGDRLKGADTYAYWFDQLETCKLAGKPLPDVTPFDLSKWRDEQLKTLKPATVARKLGLLGGFFSFAVKERGWIDRNPVSSVRKPRVSDARDRVMTDDERRYLLASATTSRAGWLADALIVLLQTAMRRGELAGLTRHDVDFSRATAHLSDTKNGSDRDVPLCPQAVDALRRLGAAAGARGSDQLIPVSDAHALTLAFRRTVGRAQEQYRKDCASSGVEPSADFLADLRLHDCRHAAITQWANTGRLGVVDLMAISGHRSTAMLRRYTHLNASDLAQRMAKLAVGDAVASATAALAGQREGVTA